MTAAAAAGAPVASGDPAGRIPFAAPLPSRRGLTWGGGRREAGSPPSSNMAPLRRRPNRRSGYSRSSSGLGAGKCGGRAPSGRSAGQCSGPGSPRRPAVAATSGRALAAASPLARGLAATSGPAGTPRPELASGGVGAEVTHTLRFSPPARTRRGTTREPRASLYPAAVDSAPRCPFAPGTPGTRLGREMGSEDSAAAFSHVPSTCRAQAAGARLRGDPACSPSAAEPVPRPGLPDLPGHLLHCTAPKAEKERTKKGKEKKKKKKERATLV